jgi:hypothetical protein
MIPVAGDRPVRRVTKDEVAAERKSEPMRGLEICLDHWTTWMGKADLDLGDAKRVPLLVGDGDAYGENGDDEDAAPAEGNAYYRASGEIGMAVDASVMSLPKHLQWAIKKRCGLSKVWIYPHIVLYNAVQEAEQMLIKMLKKNVATRAFF